MKVSVGNVRYIASPSRTAETSFGSRICSSESTIKPRANGNKKFRKIPDLVAMRRRFAPLVPRVTITHANFAGQRAKKESRLTRRVRETIATSATKIRAKVTGNINTFDTWTSRNVQKISFNTGDVLSLSKMN